LFGVTDQNNASNTLDVSMPMGVLLGDTSGDGFVNSADIGQTKARSGQSLSSANFRSDVNVDGFLNSADIGLVKSKSGTALPTTTPTPAAASSTPARAGAATAWKISR
jgi:hypothetical protein